MKSPLTSLAWATTALLITLTICTTFLIRECARFPSRVVDHTFAAARQAAEIFREAIGVQPKVIINQTVFFDQIASVAEFAVITRDQTISLSYSHQMTLLNTPLPATEKIIKIDATFRIKAGFDLMEPFTVAIDPQTLHLTAELPPAQILSVEPVGPLSYTDQDGWFNRITAQERQNLLNELQIRARTAAETSNCRQEAERQAVSRLSDLAQRNGQSATFHFRLSNPENTALPKAKTPP
jgi:hypothetical protein